MKRETKSEKIGLGFIATLLGLFAIPVAILLTFQIRIASSGSFGKQGNEERSSKLQPVPLHTVRLLPATASDVSKAIDQIPAEVTLVNLWATWCTPCVEEFPAIMELHNRYESKGLGIIFVSTDRQADQIKVKNFLADHGVDFTTYIKAEADDTFINGVTKDWSGALPATLIYNRKKDRVAFWEGPKSKDEFEKAILEAFQDQPIEKGKTNE